jgi:hypothetical protein
MIRVEGWLIVGSHFNLENSSPRMGLSNRVPLSEYSNTLQLEPQALSQSDLETAHV